MATMIYLKEPGERDLTAYRGATFYEAFTFYDSNDAAVNLTGWSARFTVWPKNSPDATTASLALTSTPAAGITLGGAAGTVVIKATPTQMTAMPAGQYDYQFEFEDGAGDIQVYYKGTFTVNEDVP